MNANLGQRIAAFRERLGLRQEDLAQRVGVSRVSVSKYENGLPPRADTMQRIARALMVEVGALYDVGGPVPPAADGEACIAKFAGVARELTEAECDQLIAMARTIVAARAGGEA